MTPDEVAVAYDRLRPVPDPREISYEVRQTYTHSPASTTVVGSGSGTLSDALRCFALHLEPAQREAQEVFDRYWNKGLDWKVKYVAYCDSHVTPERITLYVNGRPHLTNYCLTPALINYPPKKETENG